MLANFKPTKAPNQRWPKLPRIEYPEDSLVQSYYARHPEVPLPPWGIMHHWALVISMFQEP